MCLHESMYNVEVAFTLLIAVTCMWFSKLIKVKLLFNCCFMLELFHDATRLNSVMQTVLCLSILLLHFVAINSSTFIWWFTPEGCFVVGIRSSETQRGTLGKAFSRGNLKNTRWTVWLCKMITWHIHIDLNNLNVFMVCSASIGSRLDIGRYSFLNYSLVSGTKHLDWDSFVRSFAIVNVHITGEVCQRMRVPGFIC